MVTLIINSRFILSYLILQFYNTGVIEGTQYCEPPFSSQYKDKQKVSDFLLADVDDLAAL